MLESLISLQPLNATGHVAPPGGGSQHCSQAEQHILHDRASQTGAGQREEPRQPTDVSRTPGGEHAVHFQTMLKTKLNVLTLRKEPLPTVIFHEPEAIELCSTTPLTKGRTHAGYKVAYLGKVTISGTQFLSGCTESAVVGLVEQHGQQQCNSLLEIRPFQCVSTTWTGTARPR
ncbi:hypothetical protein F7725_021069 [Dissostichus mawsoni]|uniref:Uncharacterized protein n=1 Tax=Dissostichus mawsoni TaxID=36200 RepID=A0A7J5YGB9_DISMA|nr:hypothetical protein F7725_021069 [Dissostichus mawsoni]